MTFAKGDIVRVDVITGPSDDFVTAVVILASPNQKSLALAVDGAIRIDFGLMLGPLLLSLTDDGTYELLFDPTKRVKLTKTGDTYMGNVDDLMPK